MVVVKRWCMSREMMQGINLGMPPGKRLGSHALGCSTDPSRHLRDASGPLYPLINYDKGMFI